MEDRSGENSVQLFDHCHWSHAVYRMCVRNDVEVVNVVGMDENAVKIATISSSRSWMKVPLARRQQK